MSIIERVVKLIDPDDERQQSSPAPEQRDKPADAITRSIGDGPDPLIGREGETNTGHDREQPSVFRQRDRQKHLDYVSAVHAPVDTVGHSQETPAEVRAVPNSDARVRPPFVIDREHLRRHGAVEPDGARTPVAECFRLIKSQLLLGATSAEGSPAPGKVIMVTSALPGEGKTYCAVNLAISIALERDRSVMLIDGDVANPSVPGMLGLAPGRGLMDLLVDQKLAIEDFLCTTDIGKLSILQAGTAHSHATELLASDAMRALIQEVSERYQDRIVIFDSPPLLAASEAGVLAGHIGQIVVVVEAGKTSERILEDALGRIDVSKVAGLVLNKGRGHRQGYGYGAYA
jgi:protein-tyrosine kinase